MLLNNAIQLALSLYDRATWPDGTLKVIHPLEVLIELDSRKISDQDTQSLAVLHDVLEDFPEHKDAIRLVAEHIWEDLETLTRKTGTPYFGYIDDICTYGSDRALLVKLCDVTVNMRRKDLTESHRRRYASAYERLSAEQLQRKGKHG